MRCPRSRAKQSLRVYASSAANSLRLPERCGTSACCATSLQSTSSQLLFGDGGPSGSSTGGGTTTGGGAFGRGAVYRFRFYDWTFDQAYKEMKQYDFYTSWGHQSFKDFVQEYYARMQASNPEATQQDANSVKVLNRH